MELALNLAWLVIAVASYSLLALQLSNRDAARSRAPSRCQCIVSLTCALVILFPIISLTDDLHEMQATVEEASSSRVVMKRCGVNHSLTPTRTPHQLLCVFSSPRADADGFGTGIVVTNQAAHASPGLSSTTFGRAPPFFPLSSAPISKI